MGLCTLFRISSIRIFGLRNALLPNVLQKGEKTVTDLPGWIPRRREGLFGISARSGEWAVIAQGSPGFADLAAETDEVDVEFERTPFGNKDLHPFGDPVAGELLRRQAQATDDAVDMRINRENVLTACEH